RPVRLGGWMFGDGVRVMGVMVVMATMVMFGPGKGRRHRQQEKRGSEENLLHAKKCSTALVVRARKTARIDY
ncbi:MAG: hypothetical protein WBW68_14925, partial [Terracidiphilus sp.]